MGDPSRSPVACDTEIVAPAIFFEKFLSLPLALLAIMGNLRAVSTTPGFGKSWVRAGGTANHQNKLLSGAAAGPP
jgi:hypothetical protein